MGVIQEKANAIVADMQKNDVEKRTFDPMLIVTVVEVIYYLIKIYKECHTPQQAALSMRHPGLIERLRLRRVVRQNLKPEMQLIAPQIIQSTFIVAHKIEDTEVSKMYEEVDKEGT